MSLCTHVIKNPAPVFLGVSTLRSVFYDPLASLEKGKCYRVFFVFCFGRLASSRPPPDPISTQLHRHHPSLSLVPLCGHTKTLFVLALPALLQTYHHPNAQPRGVRVGGDVSCLSAGILTLWRAVFRHTGDGKIQKCQDIHLSSTSPNLREVQKFSVTATL